MSKLNIETVRGYIETVLNQKQFDRVFEFCSQDCLSRYAPYVGLGIASDDISGERVIVTETAKGGPADGHILPGDELVRVIADGRTWETFQDLKSWTWARGVVGTPLTVTVRRNGNLVTIPLTRGQVDSFDLKLADYVEDWEKYIERDWRDLECEIKMIFGEDDLVTAFLIIRGDNQEYDRSAIWSEVDIFRLAEGKITEIWAIEDTLNLIKQLGYDVTEPVREVVAA